MKCDLNPWNYKPFFEVIILHILFFYVSSAVQNFGIICHQTAKNTEVSANFLVWKYCGNAHFFHRFLDESSEFLKTLRF